MPFSGEVYIEQDDFREVPPPKYYRLSPGKEVRLRNAYFITAQQVVKDAAGNIVEVHCTYDPASRGGNSPDGRKVKSTMHWVSAAHAISAEIRLYGNLFAKPDPYDLREGQDVLDNLNPNSVEGASRRQARALSSQRQAGGPLPVRARRLLLPRSRLHSRKSSLQPYPAAKRLVGQDRKEVAIAWSRLSLIAGISVALFGVRQVLFLGPGESTNPKRSSASAAPQVPCGYRIVTRSRPFVLLSYIRSSARAIRVSAVSFSRASVPPTEIDNEIG